MGDDFLKEIQQAFLLEATENLAQTEALFLSLEKSNVDHGETFVQLKRLAHNFKGSGKAVSFDDLSSFSHSIENLLIALSSNALRMTPVVVDLLLECNDALREDLETLKADPETRTDRSDMIARIEAVINAADGTGATETPTASAAAPLVGKPFIKPKAAPAETSAAASADNYIRIPLKRIEDLFNSFGEQVIYLSAIEHYKDDMANNLENIERILFNLKKITYDLQQSTLSLRMINLKGLYAKLERSIRDVSRSTGKPIDLQLEGAAQELDKTIVDQISDALLHMVRNAVDHGIESKEERASKSKPAEGRISISAHREAGSFIIVIQDDGKGLDPVFIRNKAISKGLISADAQLTDRETYDLLFEPGFSTAEVVSEISGRGVGMNVVKEVILSLNGRMDIKSEVGVGTTFTIKLPLSLSLFNGLSFTVHGQRYIVPSSQVIEVVDSSSVEIREIGDSKSRLMQLRDSVFGLLDLRALYKTRAASDEAPKREMILVAEIEGEQVGFQIHHVNGIVRVVQKPLGGDVASCPGAVGVTILGDGNPALILDLRILSNELRPHRKKAA